MKTYLFGISTYAHKMVESGALSEYSIQGLFDNAPTKWGTEAFGLKIERPYFDPEVEIIVAVNPTYYQESHHSFLIWDIEGILYSLKEQKAFMKRKSTTIAAKIIRAIKKIWFCYIWSIGLI